MGTTQLREKNEKSILIEIFQNQALDRFVRRLSSRIDRWTPEESFQKDDRRRRMSRKRRRRRRKKERGRF